MAINSIEWSEAQGLLVKLVQLLSPVAEFESISAISSLNKRMYIPSLHADPQLLQIRHPVTLLTTLYSMQKQVTHWVSEGADPVELKAASLEKGTEEPLVSNQAKRLIDQVQMTISKLCTSNHIKDPKEEPLREMLRDLKPGIDKIIETLTGIKEQVVREVPKAFFRHPLPVSPRVRLLEKLADRDLQNLTVEKINHSEPSGGLVTILEKRSEKKQRHDVSSKPQPEHVLKKDDQNSEKSSHISILKQEKAVDKPVDKKPLPVIAFIASSRAFSPPTKLKKKHRGFRFADDDEKEKEKE